MPGEEDAQLQTPPITLPQVSSVSGFSFSNTPENFVGGKIHSCSSQWRWLTKDEWIFNVLEGNVLEFYSPPVQCSLPRPLFFPVVAQAGLDSALLGLLQRKVIEPCKDNESGGFYSNVFPVLKKDGTARVILNLRDLNPYIKYYHFKMDSITDVVNLIQRNCYFITVDFKDAYFSVFVKPEDRKWLKFRWENQVFQFTCLPQGLSSAPRIFTKLLKPVFSHLRKLGIAVSCYIDDCIFLATSEKELIENVRYALQLFDELGLTVHERKSVLVPTQVVEFLGIVLDSVNMTASLPPRRKERIKSQGALLLRGDPSIQDLASFIGLAVASEPAVNLAPLRYKYLEYVKNENLVIHKGNYHAHFSLDAHAKSLVNWWILNIDSQSRSLLFCPPQLELQTDASLTGWGAVFEGTRTGGHWAQDELDHINCLELKAILLGLKALCNSCRQTHIRLKSDNTTAVACLNRRGSKIMSLHSLVEEIFDWALQRGITLSAEYVRGVENAAADQESRIKNYDSEWMLKPHIFSLLCDTLIYPKFDLFASRINAQLPAFASWKPDPLATHTNAFTFDWNNMVAYAFPPFSVIGKVLQKLQEEGSTVLTVLPLWPTQVWFPKALLLLADTPVLLPQESLVLPQDPACRHPQASKLKMTAMLLSGNPSKIRAFRMRLPAFSFSHGDRVRNSNMGHISIHGCLFVSAGKLIRFDPL